MARNACVSKEYELVSKTGKGEKGDLPGKGARWRRQAAVSKTKAREQMLLHQRWWTGDHPVVVLADGGSCDLKGGREGEGRCGRVGEKEWE